MGKRKATFEELFDVVFEFTGLMWQLGISPISTS
jgi:hypothetical protein